VTNVHLVFITDSRRGQKGQWS